MNIDDKSMYHLYVSYFYSNQSFIFIFIQISWFDPDPLSFSIYFALTVSENLNIYNFFVLFYFLYQIN